MSLYRQLQAREEAQNPIRVGVIGAGKFGTMYLSQALNLPGIHVLGVADLNPTQARSNMELAHWPVEQLSAQSLESALQSGATHLTDNAQSLISHPAVEIIIDCTGDPVVACDHLTAAFAHGKHVVSATVEADSFCGAALAQEAEKAGVLYSMAYGDQPAMTCELVDWARTCGFEVVAAGRGHKWKPEYRFSTPDTIWDHWGLTAEQAKRGRLNPRMFNSFLDGTKPAIESAAIANACGLDAPSNGLAYPSGSIDDLPSQMRPLEDGGELERTGLVEVQNCLDAAGGQIGYDIRMGVWVVMRATSEYQRRCFEEYKVTTDDTGRYFAAYKRWHLIGLELGMSVANVALRGETTGTARAFRADVISIAKRDLKAGEIVDGEGGYMVAGQLRPAKTSLDLKALPLGLTRGARLKRSVKRDDILTFADVELDEATTAFALRKSTECLMC